jgi:FAD binding domain
MTNTASDVLIVGAGPTGLTPACTPAQRGVRVRIVDAASAPARGSRGKGLQPRTLELFDDLGIIDSAPPGLIGPQGARRVFDLLRGPHTTLLGFGTHWQSVIENCLEQFKGSLQAYVIVPQSAGGTPGHYTDAEGHARAAYGESALFVVRPDNYIGMAAIEPVAAPIVDYLSRHIAPFSHLNS